MTQRYEIRPIRYYYNTKTGQTTSLFTGTLPGDRGDWEIREAGYGWWDHNTGTMHGTHGQTREEVVARIRNFNPAFEDNES